MDSKIHLVSSLESPEFTLLTESLAQSPLVGLDAEWKPIRTHQSSFPNVSLLQLACQLGLHSATSLVFLLDLSAIPLSSIYELLRDVFVSPDVLKLGFRFKQDLIYLSSTFSSQGCDPGFDRVIFSFFCNCVSACRKNRFTFSWSNCVFGYRENGERWTKRKNEMKAGAWRGFSFKRGKEVTSTEGNVFLGLQHQPPKMPSFIYLLQDWLNLSYLVGFAYYDSWNAYSAIKTGFYIYIYIYIMFMKTHFHPKTNCGGGGVCWELCARMKILLHFHLISRKLCAFH